MLDPRRQEKLQELVRTLGGQAQQAEKDGNADDAARLYIKLIDVLLLLARESGDNHLLWVKYTKQAEAYQGKVKALISSGRVSDTVKSNPAFGGGVTPKVATPPIATGATFETPLPGRQQIATAAVEQNPASPNKESTLKKILKPFQRNDSEPQVRQSYVIPEYHQRSGESTPSLDSSKTPQSFAGVPYDLFQQVLGESRYLQDRVEALTKERESLSESLEAMDKELIELKSNTVPKEDYEALQAKLLQSQTAKAQLEKVEEGLRNSVPKSQYDELLTKISDMVPRDVYIEAEVRAAKFELQLKNTVPRNVLDDLASQVSLISTLSSIPLDEEKTVAQKAKETEEDDLKGQGWE